MFSCFSRIISGGCDRCVEKALSYGILSYDGVINLLYQIHQPATESLSLRVNSPPVRPNRVDQFDLLLRA